MNGYGFPDDDDFQVGSPPAGPAAAVAAARPESRVTVTVRRACHESSVTDGVWHPGAQRPSRQADSGGHWQPAGPPAPSPTRRH